MGRFLFFTFSYYTTNSQSGQDIFTRFPFICPHSYCCIRIFLYDDRCSKEYLTLPSSISAIKIFSANKKGRLLRFIGNRRLIFARIILGSPICFVSSWNLQWNQTLVSTAAHSKQTKKGYNRLHSRRFK